jgi:hypothetical protein
MKEKILGKADVHIHSTYSDGDEKIEDILEYAQNHTDLDVIAISDHDTIEGALMARDIMQTKSYNAWRFELIIGEEITTNEGHIVGLFLKEAIPPNLSVQETLARIRVQKGLAIASHPFYHSHMNNAKYATMDGIGATTLLRNSSFIDAIEIVNATPTLSEDNIRASILNKTLLFNAEVGNSDAHILAAIGMGYTLFEGKTAADFRRAVLQHQTRAMYKNWSYLGLFKYGFFYFPRGLRLLIHTILHGRRHRPPDLLEEEIRAEENV